VGGAETHEMDILGPHTNSAASSLQSTYPTQDINEGRAESSISRIEGVITIYPSCYLTPRQSFCSVTGSGGSDATRMNIDGQSRSSDYVSNTTGDRLPLDLLPVISVCSASLVLPYSTSLFTDFSIIDY
jgi:hypothetical protein